MINFNFTKPNNENPEGIIHISIDNTNINIFKENQFPFTVIHKSISNRVLWVSKLYRNMFSSYGFNTNTTIEIIDNLGNTITTWKWDTFQHGDFCHQIFKLWSQNNKKSNGIAIGTHDGTTGEWVVPVISGELNATLVESSEYQFKNLVSTYGKLPWVNTEQLVVTSNGENVVFYEGGEGFTNSVNYDLIKNYVLESEINKKEYTTISINDLIIKSNINGPVKWIHIDVEGLDGELVYSIDDHLLPELLIFESLHMNDDYKSQITSYLESKGYNVQHSGWNTICLKK